MSEIDLLLTISKASKMLGVHTDTLRDWSDEGVVLSVRTPGGHRRFPLSEIHKHMGVSKRTLPTNRTAIYCRVSSQDQKEKGDLERQVGRVTNFCLQKDYQLVVVLQDVGSGISNTRPRLRQLFELVNKHHIDRVVIEHKDRLTRFGFKLLQSYFDSHKVTIEWTLETLGKSYEQELVEDILSIMSSFSARLYGRRSAKNRKVAKEV